MGASISSNAAAMVADVYSSSTSTTTITDVNSNASSQTMVFDNCTVTAGDDINITQAMTQVQNIQQTASVQNTQLSTTSVDQSLIQEAQSSVSSWGIGVASASNAMSVATSVSTSVKNAVDVSFSNLNSSAQAILCSNSTMNSGGNVNISQSGAQAITATQVSTSTNLQSVTTDVSQSATQTATATVSGLDFMGMIVAGIVLVVVIGIVMAVIKAKLTKGADSPSLDSTSLDGVLGPQLKSPPSSLGPNTSTTIGSALKSAASGLGRQMSASIGSALSGLGAPQLKAGGLYRLTPTELKLFVAGAVLAIILAVLGAVGLLQRPQHACDFTGQCTPTSSQFWFSTAGSTCTVSDRYTLLSGASTSKPPVAPVATLVAPPLFMCNALRSSVTFGGTATASLYPGVLQLLVVASKVNNSSTSTTDTSTLQRNNSGYNLGVFSELLRTATKTVDSTDARTPYIQALAAWFWRQTFTLGDDDKPLVAMPTSTTTWSAASILQDLLPIQPVTTMLPIGARCTSPGNFNIASTDNSSASCYVRLPGSFLADTGNVAGTGAATSYVTYLCLPNVFVPDLDSDPGQASLFLGNSAESDSFPSGATTCTATALASLASGANTSTAIFKSTCVQTPQVTVSTTVPNGTSAPPSLATDYACGCLTWDAGQACWGDNVANYSELDQLCYVNSTVINHTTTTTPAQTTYSRRGGFILRKASTLDVYSTEGTTVTADAYYYTATPSTTRVDAWRDANSGSPAGLRMLYMFVRVYWWLLLTADVANRTLSELGLSTFVNEGGFDEATSTPNVPLDSPDIAQMAMYSAQPLLVRKSGGTYAFYSLQELEQGVATSAALFSRTVLTDQAACLAQVGTWCYDNSQLSVVTEVASPGFNVNLTGSTSSAASQISASTAQRGLLVGRHGYCRLWFTDDAYVGTTLGVACGIVVVLLVYAILMNAR